MIELERPVSKQICVLAESLILACDVPGQPAESRSTMQYSFYKSNNLSLMPEKSWITITNDCKQLKLMS
jgi:hypothetical protein